MNFLVKFVYFIGSLFGFNFVTLYGVNIPVVNSGDGLYYDDGVYVYKGFDVDNYIYFKDELWRIISIGDDVKIVRDRIIGEEAFDVDGSNEWDDSSLRVYLSDFYDGAEILSMDDYLGSNSNVNMCGSLDLYFDNDCFLSSYINTYGSKYNAVWTLTKDEDTVFYAGNTYFGDGSPSDDGFGVLPVLYLRGDFVLVGDGTLQKSYKVVFE